MIFTYCDQFKTRVMTEYLSYNLVALLISSPNLGITDTPSSLELANRKALTMVLAAAAEIPLTNGYSRQLVNLTLGLSNTPGIIVYDATASFTANNLGALSPATHICYARGVNLDGADSILNGNKRGDTFGTIVKVEPLLNAPVSIPANTTFTHQTTFSVSSQLLS